jgi:hypothetical protein
VAVLSISFKLSLFYVNLALLAKILVLYSTGLDFYSPCEKLFCFIFKVAVKVSKPFGQGANKSVILRWV